MTPELDDPTAWPVKPVHRHSQHVVIYRSHGLNTASHPAIDWRWRLVAGNGRIIDASSEGYMKRSQLVRNIEQSLHLTMLDQDRYLIGPKWFLYGVELVYPAPLQWLEAGELSTGHPVQGVKIRVETPDGRWGSRVSRS